jgi:hypothetical protein
MNKRVRRLLEIVWKKCQTEGFFMLGLSLEKAANVNLNLNALNE